MQAGKKFSRIVQAIAEAEALTTGEIRVHISKRWFERDPLARAQALFERFEMHQTSGRNGVLLYVNLRKHRFAIYGDEGIHARVGQKYWEQIARELSQDLRATHHENAIAIAVRKMGTTLSKYFPSNSESGSNPNELQNDVTADF